MGRISIKHIFYILLIILGLIYIYSLNYWESHKTDDGRQVGREISSEKKFENLTCFVNREVSKNIGVKHSNKNVQCKTDGSEVFVPFSFLSHYYELRGSMVDNNRGKDLHSPNCRKLYPMLQSSRSPSPTPRCTLRSPSTPPWDSSCISRPSTWRGGPG